MVMVDSEEGHEMCYKLNLAGDMYGNCGNTLETYLPCTER